MCRVFVATFFLLSARDNEKDIKSTQRAFDTLLMRKFFSKIPTHAIPWDIHSEFCPGNSTSALFGITCEEGKVVGVEYNVMGVGDFHIEFLPQSVHFLELISSEQSYSIESRCLPACLHQLRMDDNRISGTFDLTVLPSRLRWVSLEDNGISGPINLTMLPRTLAHLNLSRNPLRQKTVYWANLPPNECLIFLRRCGVEQTKPLHKGEVNTRAGFLI